MKTSNVVLVTIIILLLASNIYMFSQWLLMGTELKALRDSVKIQQTNAKVVDFTKLFISKVLRADAVVSFEDRLKLENAVRDLKNESVLSQWQKFANSKTEKDAQVELNNLLEVLVGNIKY